MIEYELSVNIVAESADAIENLLITVEAINSGKVNVGAIELLSISGLALSNQNQIKIADKYEHDSWLSPLAVE